VEGGAPAYVKVLGRYGDATENGETRYVAQVFHERGDGFREQPFDATDALAKIAFPTGRLGEATLKVSFHDETDASAQVGLTREMFAEDPRRPSLGIHDELSIRKYDVALIHELPVDEETTLRTLLFAYTTSRIWRQQDYGRSAVEGARYERIVGDPRIPNGAVFFGEGDTINDRSYDVAGIEERIEHDFSTGGLRHTLYAGARFLAETAQRKQRSGETPTSFAGSVDSDESSVNYAVAVYAQDKMAATDYLLVTPGVRFEHADFERDIHRAFVDGAAADVAISGTSAMNEVLPGIGMILGTEDNHAFGGFHVGFAPPRLATAITADGINAQLDAERSLAYEVGARLTPLAWAHVDVTGFLSNYGNQVIPAAGAGRQGTLQNAGQTRHAGVEGSVSAGVGDALDLGMSIDVGARYTFSYASFAAGQFEGNLLPYAPLHTGSATLDVEHPIGAGAQLAVIYAGDQFTDEENTLQEDAGGRVGLIDAHVVVDLAARYRHAPTGLTASVSVKNLLDQPYVSTRRPDGIFPSGFRQITFGLQWDYEAPEAPPEEPPAP
jgi:Fe(3+) dicitrate transport protein